MLNLNYEMGWGCDVEVGWQDWAFCDVGVSPEAKVTNTVYSVQYTQHPNRLRTGTIGSRIFILC